MIKVLNSYAGLGGNRLNWKGCKVTAVEYSTDIANTYLEQNACKKDKVVIADAHQYLLEHFQEFDFIWSSPPCQSHSRMIRSGRNRKSRYPDLRLYEEIMLLQNDFKGLWVVENVVPYYKPPIPPTQKIGRHLFWSNFDFEVKEIPEFKNFINRQNLKAKGQLMEWLGIFYDKNIYYDGNHCPTQVLRNCVHPVIGEQIFNQAKKILKKRA